MRSFNLWKTLFVCALMVVLLSGMAVAQGVGASGDITGTVTDQSGAIIAGATITVTDVAKGTKHIVTSDSNGQFRVQALLPATYSVSVMKGGFQAEIAKAVQVGIGQTSIVDFKMKVSQVSEALEVTTEAPLVETDKGQQANVVSEQYIRELPINRRDYLTFTLLAPAVTDSTRLAGDQDFRVKQTPQSGLSFYGSNGRGNSVTVDGGEANDDAGGVRLNVGQDAVQEFQINRSNYGVELGGASGATINIVTKSGTNNTHGSLFALFRNDGMDAANPFAKSQALQPGQTFNPALPDSVGRNIKDTLKREQFGASIGLPIKHDKTFFFTSFEGLMNDSQNAVTLFNSTSVFRPNGGQQAILGQLATLAGNPPVPCLTGQPALPAATCAAILTNVLTVNPATSPLNAFIVNQFENNGGLFPYTTRLYLASSRLDHQFSDKNQVLLRYSFGHDREENPDVQSLTGFSRGSSVHAFDNTLAAAHFHQFSAKTLTEIRAQFNYSGFNVIPNVPGEVGLDIPGFANLGTQIFLPSLTIMRRYEIADNFSTIRGKHNFKFGGYELYRGNHSESHTFFPGRFVFGNLPGGLLSPCLQVPAACGLTAAAQTISPLQSVSLGLPQFYQQGFGNPVYNYPRPYTSAYAQDQWAVRPNLQLTYGVRYEVDSQYGALVTDKNNFAPRAAFSWDPFNDKKTVIRGGYGLFYSPVYGQIADVVQTLGLVNGNRQIAQIFVPITGAPGNPALTSAAIFQTLFAQGKVQCAIPTGLNAACITPGDLTQFGIAITHSGAIPPLTVIFSGQSDYQNPYSQQAEFGIERQVGREWAVSVSGIYVHTIGLPVALDQNALSTAPISNITLSTGQVVPVRNFNTSTSNALTPGLAPCGGAAIVTCFANPLRLQDNVYSSKGSALYEGVIFEIKKRVSHHVGLFANYTFSKAFDTSTDFNSDFAPQDQTNLAGDRGLSDFDQRHKLVVVALLDTGHGGDGIHKLISGFEFAPIVRYNSGHPFNLLAGTDVNGDRHSTNDRPVGAARNTGQGPDFLSFDARLTRSFKMGEHGRFMFMAEGFNLLNRTNFATVNNVVGPRPDLVPGFTNFNFTGDQLGFTSAFPSRQFQLGFRANF